MTDDQPDDAPAPDATAPDTASSATTAADTSDDATSSPRDTASTTDDQASRPSATDDAATGSSPDGDDQSGDRELARRSDSPRGQVASMPTAGPRPPRRTGVFLDPQDLRAHVGDLLRAIVGSYRVDAFGNYTFDHETARIFVTVGGSPLGPIVGIFAVTNTKLSLDVELASWLARTNHGLVLGSLSWDDDNDAVWLRHNLLGTHLDPPELQAAVRAVASAAVTVGDEISERFGGHRTRPGDATQAAEGPDSGDDDGGGVDGMEAPRFDGAAGDSARTNTTGYL